MAEAQDIDLNWRPAADGCTVKISTYDAVGGEQEAHLLLCANASVALDHTNDGARAVGVLRVDGATREADFLASLRNHQSYGYYGNHMYGDSVTVQMIDGKSGVPL